MRKADVKLNIGCGADIKTGYLNCDRIMLPGVDRIADLDGRLPFDDGSVDEVLAIDVLEHVQDLIKSMEELYRILKKGGRLLLQVPYWNSWCAYADPTHKRGFHERVFEFFDPDKEACRERSYYTNARFRIISISPVIYPGLPYFGAGKIKIKSLLMKKLFFVLGNIFNNAIIDLDVILEKV